VSDELFLVRSETLSGFGDLVRRLGADPEQLYRQVGFTASLFDNPDYMLPYANVSELLEITARQLGCEDFGLLLASNRKELPIGTLGLLMVQCPDVETALKSTIEHYHLHSQGVSWNLAVEGRYAFITRKDRVASQIPTYQYTMLSMCNLLRAMKVVCGKGWRPTAVRFTHFPPARVNKLNRFFGLTVDFNQESTQLVFPASDLRREIANRDRDLEKILSDQVRALELQNVNKQDYRAKIKLLIEQSIHSQNCTQGHVADLLSMHPKTLQRELHRQGVTFRALRAQARLDAAEHYLRDSTIPLTMIAEMLGFSELSALSRAFKTRHGVSPAVWREAHARVR
jgi:AraC-like DNA-binding protein